jgi:hypothetical protein
MIIDNRFIFCKVLIGWTDKIGIKNKKKMQNNSWKTPSSILYPNEIYKSFNK